MIVRVLEMSLYVPGRPSSPAKANAGTSVIRAAAMLPSPIRHPFSGRMQHIAAGSSRNSRIGPRKAAASYSMTSSARARSAGGIVRSSALAGACQERGWDREAERFSGFHVNGQCEARGLRNGKLGRLGTTEDLLHVVAHKLVMLFEDGSVSDQTAIAHEFG